jgi:hypothetical protein
LGKSQLDLIEYSGDRFKCHWLRLLYIFTQLKARDIESLVPEGKIWRMGANEFTELTIYIPMKVVGTFTSRYL